MENSDLERARLYVSKGAPLMSEHKPRWFAVVDPARLDMTDGELCVLGQAFGSYALGGLALGLLDPECEPVGEGPWDFGFDEGLDTTYEALRMAWIEEISRRLTDEADEEQRDLRDAHSEALQAAPERQREAEAELREATWEARGL